MSNSLDLTRARMLELGIEPKKSLGQNFLVSDHVVNKICQAVRDLNPDHLIEIGPGLGALTTHLKDQFEHYNLIELDRKFADFWRNSEMNVIEADALQINWNQFFSAEKMNEKRVLVSNLPYQISSTLVIDRTLDENPLDAMVLMFQKEVAQRIRARHKTDEYGFLSVIAQMGWDIDFLLEASSGDFLPPPKVASRVLVFRKKQSLVKNKKKFLSFVKGAFSHRRKFLLNNLVGVVGGNAEQHQQAFADLKINPKARAEELSLMQMVELFKQLGYESGPTNTVNSI